MLGSCGSEAEDLDIPEGEGLVKIDLMPEVGFQTKAVDENEYKDVNKYTVQVFKSGQESNPVIEGLYGELEAEYSLQVGQYVLKAFMGEEKPVSTDKLYFYGEQGFEVKEGKIVEAPVTCKPSSVRINVVFDAKMDEYFSDYSLKIETEAQKPSSFEWKKDTVGPVYFKVGKQEEVRVTVNLTNKENVTAQGLCQNLYVKSGRCFENNVEAGYQ